MPTLKEEILKAEPDLFDIIQEKISSHRLQYTFEDHESGLQVLDRLSPDEDQDISRGKEEVEFLTEEIVSAIESKLLSICKRHIEEAFDAGIRHQASLGRTPSKSEYLKSKGITE